jgi:predicted nucleotidyltransferase
LRNSDSQISIDVIIKEYTCKEILTETTSLRETTMDPLGSSLNILEKRLSANWSHLTTANTLAEKKRLQLRDDLRGMDSEDTSVVVFGSLGRNEFTEASDIDWTLLVDGFADPKHLEVAREIAEKVRALSAKEVGREGLFGSMAFSHDLVHQIGGEDDTNRNATRRILLLLESRVIGRDEAYERVINQVLNRYVSEDHGFVKGIGKFHIPRFLLNDFARNWWTMAVDFAYKKRTRLGKGAAIRNIKLRFSRKLIYVSGLLTCFGCHMELDAIKASGICPGKGAAPDCVDCLSRRLNRTPIEILAEAFLHLPHLDETAKKIFNAYDGFLGILADETSRSCLEDLDSDSYENKIFSDARELSHEFRDGLIDLFFDTNSQMYELTKNYGVF